MSDLWQDIDHDIDSIEDGSSDEERKDRKNPDDQEHEKVISVTPRNPRRLRQGDKISLRQIESNI